MTKSYQDTKTHKKLLTLAKKSPNLPNILSKERIENFQVKHKELTYSYATQQVNENILSCLQHMSNELNLVKQFKSMIEGEIINKIKNYQSENRSVLHHNSRNIFDHLPYPFTIKNEKFNNSLTELKTELNKLEAFCKKLELGELTNEQGEKFNTIISIGIGGSHLGPQAIITALEKFAIKNRKAYFISNVDPDDASSVLKKVNLATSLILVISKSGLTLETLTNEELVKKEFQQQGLNPLNHFICITGKGSPMDNKEKYLESFYIFDYIGGRYSLCSMVGGVSLSFILGFPQFKSLLEGAREMDLNCLETDIKKNISLLAALIGLWNRNYLNYESLAILAYSQGMKYFTQHLQQCDMESNGKSVNRQGENINYHTGPIIWGEPGTNGQHAFYQLLHQSNTIVACDFLLFKNKQYHNDISFNQTTCQEKLIANCLSQALALSCGKNNKNPNKNFKGNRPSSLIISEQLNPKNIGKILAFYENKIAFQGFIWNINSFDQEGVQLGKKIANEILNAIANKNNDTEPKIKAYLQLLKQ